jgi:hypothetical protein
MGDFTALYDACVLYPAPLRDLLMHLAMTGLFRARWTDRIHDEWIRNVLANRPDLKRSQLERTRRLMNAHVLDCLVSGYEKRIDGLILPDPDDRHVLAAAIHCRADLIVTYNLNDFPVRTLDPLGIHAQHPDSFLVDLMELDAAGVCAAAKRQRQSLRNPSMTVREFLDCLAKQKLSRTAARLEEFRASL